MSSLSRHLTLFVLSVLYFISLGGSARAQSPAKSSEAPMARVARENAWRPVRADIVPQSQGTKAGEPVELNVVLLNANGEPTNALEDTALAVQAVQPSGKIETINAKIPRGSSWAPVKFQTAEAGLTKLTVSHPEKQVLGSSNFVLITPSAEAAHPKAAPTKKVIKKVPDKAPEKSPTGRAYPPFAKARLRTVSTVTYDDQTSDGQAGSTAGAEVAGPRIMLQVSGEHDSNVRADDTTFERVSIYYMDTQPPKSAIKIWLSPDHGEVKPNPVVIRKGEYAAESHWTSGWPVNNAKVTIVSVQPALPIQGENSATINFVEPVAGVAFYNPPKIMSIVDQTVLHARFYDISGRVLQTSGKRNVSVSTGSPIVKFDPSNQDTDWDFATNVTPTGWGTAQIQVVTPNYPPFTFTLVITCLGVALLCIVGGLLGSLGDIFTKRDTAHGWRIPARLMVGALAALLLCWACLIVGLPGVPAGILHNRIAVLGVSLIGGWAGIVAVRFVAKVVGVEI